MVLFPAVAFHVPNSITSEKNEDKSKVIGNDDEQQAQQQRKRQGQDQEKEEFQQQEHKNLDDKMILEEEGRTLLTTPLLSDSYSSKEKDPNNKEDKDEEKEKEGNMKIKLGKEKEKEKMKMSLRSLLNRTVVFTAPVIGLAYFSLAFIDPIASKHFELSLTLGAQGVGFMCMIPSGAYILTSSICFEIIKILGHKMTMVYGLFMIGLGYFLMGPFPPLITFFEDIGYDFEDDNEKNNIWLSWTFQVVGFTLFGVGISFMYIPAIPMMKAVLMAELKRKLGITKREIWKEKEDELLHLQQQKQEEQEDQQGGEQEEEQEKQQEEEEGPGETEVDSEMKAEDVAFIDDSLSSIFFFFVNAGQFLGPLLSGPAVNNVHKVKEMGCYPPNPSDSNIDDTYCLSGYPWTASIAAFVMFSISIIFYVFVPTLQKTLALSDAAIKSAQITSKKDTALDSGTEKMLMSTGRKDIQKMDVEIRQKQKVSSATKTKISSSKLRKSRQRDYILLVDTDRTDDYTDDDDISNNEDEENQELNQKKRQIETSPLSGRPYFHTPPHGSPSDSRCQRSSSNINTNHTINGDTDVGIVSPSASLFSSLPTSSYYVTRTLSSASTAAGLTEGESNREERERDKIHLRSNSHDATLHHNHYSIPHTLNIPQSIGSFGTFSKGKSSPLHYHYDSIDRVDSDSVEETGNRLGTHNKKRQSLLLGENRNENTNEKLTILKMKTKVERKNNESLER